VPHHVLKVKGSGQAWSIVGAAEQQQHACRLLIHDEAGGRLGNATTASQLCGGRLMQLLKNSVEYPSAWEEGV
jgi:hypothetical protein